ncbi:unnamed protein product [Didymodactylos carnosus]|uniref:Uncharacterized protein n=1 Tax=Didymodactylos carnosus TaxID=1234261 RepID=A0A813P6Y5_9BILA|nr:unnamed protein product [Didymodactylos carnosus]CAF0748168.1 unnamed protein product [Didymodactylos carnosus]CAF3525095.1 unnamed protein product [Didymodactylos carnosus]CAF3526481.1 unnamed protein product [Didymodactylos carnosus]
MSLDFYSIRTTLVRDGAIGNLFQPFYSSMDDLKHSRGQNIINLHPSPKMASKIIYWVVWLTFIVHSAFLAPADNPATKPTSRYVKQLMFGPYHDIDAYVISLFYVMGTAFINRLA